MKKEMKIIPCLDIKQGRVVKGIKFVDIKDAGDPVELARKYQEEGADGLVFLDIAAGTENRTTQLEWVRRVADVVEIPFTVGGGISDVETARALIKMGVGSISLNSAAVTRPGLIAECVHTLGTEAVVLAVDVHRVSLPGTSPKWEVLTGGGSKKTGMDALEWIEKALALGCGSVLPTVLDRDGTLEGCDLELLREIRSLTDLPIIASGGAGKMSDFSDAWMAGADCALAASVFHFGTIRIGELKDYLTECGIAVEGR